MRVIRLSETETVEGHDSAAVDELTDYYFDNKDVNKLSVVFYVAKEDSKEMKAIRKEIEEKLGSKVKFKKAKKSIKEFKQDQEEVATYLQTIATGYEVSYNTEKQIITVSGDLTAEQIQKLRAKFPTELLSINEQKVEITPGYTRDYPFSNIGGGQKIQMDVSGCGLEQ